MNNIKKTIGWADYSWNPVTGCRHGCSYCYAARMCRRFAVPWGLDPADPFRPTFHPERLADIIGFTKQGVRIFVGSMCDLFGEWVPPEWIEEVLHVIRDEYETIERCNNDPDELNVEHNAYLFLTKNPYRYGEFEFPENCWLGATVTNGDDWARIVRDGYCTMTRVAERNLFFLSWEPMLGGDFYWDYNPKFRWLILGALTGPGAKKCPPKREWIEDAVARCRDRGIAIFMKDSIRPYWNGELIREWPHEA